MPVSLVKEVHRRLAGLIGPGDLCLDATAGNGLDTLFLARQVGDDGTVHAMDVQEDALSITGSLLEHHGLKDRVSTHLTCHSKMETVIPGNAKGRIRAITFNLGYLPKGDKSITTKAENRSLLPLDVTFDTRLIFTTTSSCRSSSVGLIIRNKSLLN